MKKLVLLLTFTLSALTASADPSIKEVNTFIGSWLKSPEAANFGGHNAWFRVDQNLDHGDPVLQSPFMIHLFDPVDDPFLDPKALVGALDQALSLKFDRFFFVQIQISNTRFDVIYNARLLNPTDLLYPLPSWYRLPEGVPLALFQGIPLYIEVSVTDHWSPRPSPLDRFRVTAQYIQSGLFTPVPDDPTLFYKP